jgi:hypothetical protein
MTVPVVQRALILCHTLCRSLCRHEHYLSNGNPDSAPQVYPDAAVIDTRGRPVPNMRGHIGRKRQHSEWHPREPCTLTHGNCD